MTGDAVHTKIGVRVVNFTLQRFRADVLVMQIAVAAVAHQLGRGAVGFGKPVAQGVEGDVLEPHGLPERLCKKCA